MIETGRTSGLVRKTTRVANPTRDDAATAVEYAILASLIAAVVFTVGSIVLEWFSRVSF